MKPLAVIALGGNALLRSSQKGTYKEQSENVEQTCEQLYSLLEAGWDIIIGHGNGPQVGNAMMATCIETTARLLNTSYKEVYERMKRVGLIERFILPHNETLHSESRENLAEV